MMSSVNLLLNWIGYCGNRLPCSAGIVLVSQSLVAGTVGIVRGISRRYRTSFPHFATTKLPQTLP